MIPIGSILFRILVLPVVSMLFLVGGCTSDEPIRIGFVGGTSGHVADGGISGRDAVQMAVEEFNQSGGLDGRPVQLFLKDDRQDPQTARKGTQELIDSGVAAIIGPMTSDMAVAIVPILDKAQVPAVSPTSTTQMLAGKDDYFFRVCSTTLEFASKSAAYHIKTGDMRRICAVYDLRNKSFCENWLNNFNSLFTANGGEILAAYGFDTNLPDSFMDLAQKALAVSPEGILVIASSMDSALICQQIRKLDTQIPVTLSDWGGTERLLELGGRAVEGVTVVQTFDRNNPAASYQAFRKKFLARYKREPGFPGVYSYEAAQVVLTALARQEKGQSLKETFLSLRRFKGLQNELAFDDFGDVKRSNASISVVQNNKFVVLE